MSRAGNNKIKYDKKTTEIYNELWKTAQKIIFFLPLFIQAFLVTQ